jgi:hypothetical protein
VRIALDTLALLAVQNIKGVAQVGLHLLFPLSLITRAFYVLTSDVSRSAEECARCSTLWWTPTWPTNTNLSSLVSCTLSLPLPLSLQGTALDTGVASVLRLCTHRTSSHFCAPLLTPT